LFGAVNQPIHKSLENVLCRSGDQHRKGGLWFLPKSPDLPELNSWGGNRTEFVLTTQLTSMYNICFGPEAAESEKSNKSDSCIFLAQVNQRGLFSVAEVLPM
jgi:hypothetical protein